MQLYIFFFPLSLLTSLNLQFLNHHQGKSTFLLTLFLFYSFKILFSVFEMKSIEIVLVDLRFNIDNIGVKKDKVRKFWCVKWDF